MKIKEMEYEKWYTRSKNCAEGPPEYNLYEDQSYWKYKGIKKTYYDTYTNNVHYRISSKKDTTLEQVHSKLKEHIHASSTGV